MRFDFAEAWDAVLRQANAAVEALPRIFIALVLLGVFWLIALGVRLAARRLARRTSNTIRERRTLEVALGRILQGVIIVVGMLAAFTVIFPTFTPRDLVSALGIGGVAIGFAFKDIFQNFLAGVLLLITRPFVVGDQIVFQSYEGTVEDIQTRATFIKTYDGRRVIIPNAELFTNSVTVNTAFAKRRMEYDVMIGVSDDVERAKQLLLDVMAQAEGVAPDPKADVIVVALGEYATHLRVRWWSDSRIADVLIAQDKVLASAKERLTAAGIDIPFPTTQVLLHNQTEPEDGNRAKQREGWPRRR